MATSFIAQMIITLAKGIVGKTATLTFKPVMKTGKKCLATRPCVCGFKHAVVFRSNENASVYAIVCPACKDVAYKVHSSTDMNAAAQQGMSKGVKKLTCNGKNKDGSDCRRIVKSGGNGLCSTHKNQAPQQYTKC